MSNNLVLGEKITDKLFFAYIQNFYINFVLYSISSSQYSKKNSNLEATLVIMPIILFTNSFLGSSTQFCLINLGHKRH